MFDNIVVVCIGNICRSPTAEMMLAAQLPSKKISSAGLGALVGHDMDATAKQVAESHGLVCPPHQARQLDNVICSAADLLLVMRSEEHTSELQSRPHLVCRLLLEKKNIKHKNRSRTGHQQ